MTDVEVLVQVDSDRHPNQFKTLNLLRLFSGSGEPVYFVVESSAILDADADEPLDASYYFDEHSCPTNYVPVSAIITADNDDPHGVFDYIRSVWMPPEYSEALDKERIIRKFFPEVSSPSPAIEG